MEPIIWSEDYSVGNEQIDAEHKQLIRMINRLIDEPEATTKSETISDLLADMTKYALQHFAAEERLMRQHNYPHLQEHVAEHRAFRRKTVDLCSGAMVGAKVVPDAMLQYLSDWLVEHILDKDMAFTRYLREHGLE